MKKFLYVVLASCLVAITVFSCKKDSATSHSPTGQDARFVRIQQGVSAADDTVYLLTYDDKGHLLNLVDSINADTLSATYNSAGQLVAIRETGFVGHDSLTVSYTSAGLIQNIHYTINGEKDAYFFEYTGNLPSKSYYQTDAGQGGDIQLWRSFVYTAPGNDITGITEYDKNDQSLGLRTVTFGVQANPFMGLALFNWGNRLGLDNIASIEMIFNQHLSSSVIWYSGASNSVAYTTIITPVNNDQGKPTGVVAKQVYPDNSSLIFTWAFGY